MTRQRLMLPDRDECAVASGNPLKIGSCSRASVRTKGAGLVRREGDSGQALGAESYRCAARQR